MFELARTEAFVFGVFFALVKFFYPLALLEFCRAMAEVANEATKNEGKKRFETNWPRVLLQLHIHVFFIYGSFFLIQAKFLTLAFTFFLVAAGLLGTTAGSHRLWAHRSYSARLLLRIFLMICQTLGGNGSIYDWVLDHRIHHKFHGTDDDPYNYKRGFIYSHLSTRMTAPNPKRAELEKQIDMSDLEQDKVVMFQKKFYWILMPIINLLLPVNAPVEYWNERMLTSAMILILFRMPVVFHGSWLVNSGRSLWGLKPNDRFFSDSNLVFLIKKNHWHEYHYTVPWDCLTGEYGKYNSGCTTAFIKIWAVMGLAEDLKTINSKGTTLALKRALETGKPIGDCLTEVREETLLNEYEEYSLL